jgi:hypothetical protein
MNRFGSDRATAPREKTGRRTPTAMKKPPITAFIDHVCVHVGSTALQQQDAQWRVVHHFFVLPGGGSLMSALSALKLTLGARLVKEYRHWAAIGAAPLPFADSD